MKKTGLILLIVALAIGIVLPASTVSGLGDYGPLVIYKTIPEGGPDEVFTFQVYRDFNNNGTLDPLDVWVGDVVIDTAISDHGSTMVPWLGPYVIHEVLSAGSAYEQADDQCVTGLDCPPVNVTFDNKVIQELGQILILKQDGSGNALAGATFVITPDPKTGTGSLTVVDNGLNDELPLIDGELLVTGCQVCLTCTVTETVPPPGYTVAPPQTAHVTVPGETVTLTFIDTRTPTCGTVCAAQGPGCCQNLFGGGQTNWFTYITYNKGDGTELSPKTYPIYTGQTTLCGTLYVYDKVVSPGVTHIFVNYKLEDTDSCTLAGLSAYHLQVDRSLANLKRAIVNKSGNPVPGRCEYIGTLDPMKPATGWIEATNDNISSWTTAWIFAHGVGCYYCP